MTLDHLYLTVALGALCGLASWINMKADSGWLKVLTIAVSVAALLGAATIIGISVIDLIRGEA